ncbi:right-handed parallel beta-helix repeat-containing protein [Streptomyces abyssalis]|nr:hypothetical protein [Streptomyces abyssalis]
MRRNSNSLVIRSSRPSWPATGKQRQPDQAQQLLKGEQMAVRRPLVKSLLTTGMAALLWVTALAAPPPAAALAVIVVGTPSATCPNPQHATIQAAVDAAAPGDTIEVCAGTYNEGVNVSKSLNFRGARAGVDARSGRTNPAQESIVTPPADDDGFFVETGVSNVTIDGFTIRGATEVASDVQGISTLFGGSGFRIVNNIITDNTMGINFRSRGPDAIASLISRNRIVDNNRPGSGLQGIFIGGGSAPANVGTDNTTITENLFGEHEGQDINTQGVLDGSDPSEDLTITGNRSVDSRGFLILLNSNDPVVSSNHIQKPVTGISGNSMRIDANTHRADVSGNVISSGRGTGINVSAIFGNLEPSTELNLERNVINRIALGTAAEHTGAGVRVSALDSGTFFSNVLSRNHRGIQVVSTVDPVTPLLFNRNVARGSTLLDAEDETTGGGTQGTANTWTQNVCPKDSPPGICV